MNHLHLILKAKGNNLTCDVESHENWIKQLVSDLNMKLLKTKQGVNPISAFCDKKGNEGITVACVIETSHIVLHTWTVKNEIQLDVYTCGKLDVDLILTSLHRWDVYDVQYKIFDRKYDLVETGDLECQN